MTTIPKQCKCGGQSGHGHKCPTVDLSASQFGYGVWQPIETAPKDKEILIYKNGDQYCGYFAKNIMTDDEGWVIANFGDNGEQLLVRDPTHWMPLPDAPYR